MVRKRFVFEFECSYPPEFGGIAAIAGAQSTANGAKRWEFYGRESDFSANDANYRRAGACGGSVCSGRKRKAAGVAELRKRRSYGGLVPVWF